MLLLLALFLSIGMQAAMAQARTVSGKVLDDKGEGVPGASVGVKGTQGGTISDIDGNFQLNLPEGHDVLVISALGFAEKEVKVTDPSQSLVVNMEKGSAQTVDVVKIYGQAIDPKTNTGSVTTVTAEQIAKKPITNIVKALDGAPGIQITSGGGQPGSTPDMHVRGFGSLSASSAPLIVVDGSIYDGTLSSLNPSDVASISLLKDASASSLYGARGANGVILVTTKTGVKGDKPQINVDGQVGFVNRMLPAMKTVNQAQYYQMAFQMYRNFLGLQADQPVTGGGMQNFLTQILGGYNAYNMPIDQLIDPITGQVNPSAQLLYNDNWMDELSRNGLRQQYNVSVSNADDKSDYYFSLGYNNDEGIVKYTNYQRITSRLNVNSHVTPWLKAGISLSGNYEDQRNFVQQENAYSNPFLTAQLMGPIFPVYKYDSLGHRQYNADGTPMYDFGDNPEEGKSRHFGKNTNVIGSLQLDDRTNQTYSARGITYLEANFLKDFTFRTDFTLDYANYNNNFYGNMLYGDFKNLNGVVQKTLLTSLSYTFRQMLTWKPSFALFANDNSLEVTLDHENYLLTNHNYFLERTGFSDVTYKEAGAAAYPGASSSSLDYLASESYLAVATYDYKKKYFAKASFRRDGSSRFSPSARWGNFWSVGGGWAIGEENFLKDVDWLSQLKIRASYGIQGNENLGADYYSWLSTYYFNPNINNPGYSFNTWGNPDLHWEGSYMFDAGVDFGFLNNRISGSLDFYNRGSNDLLYVRPYAPSTGIGGIQDNVGSMENQGVELQVNADVVRTHDFTWNAQLGLQHYVNKVTAMQGGDSIIGDYTLMTKGVAVNSYFLPSYAGVDKTTGAELWYLKDGSTTSDYSIASLAENRRVQGSAFRDLEGSFASTFSYKGIDLYFLITFGLGGKFYDNNYQLLMSPDNALQGYTWSTDILDSWTPQNPNATLPRLDIGDPNIGKPSDRFLISSSFLKIQTINLGYTLPAKWLNGAKFRTARIYVAADNVFLLAARKGVDIQQSFFGSSSLTYYPYRSVMFGINLGL